MLEPPWDERRGLDDARALVDGFVDYWDRHRAILRTRNLAAQERDQRFRDVRNRTMAHRTECASILLEAGATMSPRDDGYRSTPLAWAARNNLPDMVEFLLGRGAPTSLPDDRPWATPLAWATRRGHAHIVRRLRQAGAAV